MRTSRAYLCKNHQVIGNDNKNFEEVWRRYPIQERHWAPPVEMFEKEDKFVIKFELPGIKGDEIDVSVVGDTLTVKGKRKSEAEVKEEDYYACERLYGRCSRIIALPATADAKKD